MSTTTNKIIESIPKIKKLLQFQFESTIFDSLFDNPKDLRIEFSKKTKKFKLIHYKGKRYFSFRPDVGKFSLSIYAAKYLYDNSIKPNYRVTVMNDIQEYIMDGKSVFSKHVTHIAEHLKPNDEVIVVNENDEFLGVGKLKIPALDLYCKKSTGMAVDTKKGVKKLK